MTELTFAFDVQINDNEDYIPAGTKVKVSDNEFHINRYEDTTPVIIEEVVSYDGEVLKISPRVEWIIGKESFVELR